MDEAELASKLIFKDILDGELIVARAYEPLTQAIVRQLIQLATSPCAWFPRRRMTFSSDLQGEATINS